jgi:dTDP-4-dehydrorhamnose reductase
MTGSSPLRIAVIGKTGQVAQAIANVDEEAGVSAIFLGRPEVDLEQPQTIAPALERTNAAAIVNASAYTAVDKAESEPERAEAVNGAGPGIIGAAAAKLGVPVVHLSTDYVFPGTEAAPRRESDPTGPLSVYGATKLRGELALAAANPNHAILRTAWVHAPWGANFVRTMLRLAHSREELGVVDDQHGSPTSATAIAQAVLKVAKNLAAGTDPKLRGVFHLTCDGATTWAGFASEIFRISGEMGGPVARVRRITTAEFPTPARRPAYSRLECGKIRDAHGVVMPMWSSVVTDSVRGHLTDLEKRGWQ